MRLTELNRPRPTTVAATLVLVVAAMLAGRGDAADPFAGTVSLESGVGAPVTDRALRAPDLPAVSVGEAKVKHDKGTPKLASSAYSELDIPDTALAAYQRAAVVMEQVDESCGLSWTLLAAIGRVESDHGRYAGSQLLTDGTSSPEIRGVPLDGRGPVAKIPDTDGGRLDRDTLWDRAVGPMQFLPSTWSVVGVDADSDGVRSPHDIDDAALATAVFLCSAPGSLDTRTGLRTAILRYNPSSSYVASVLAVERSYRAGDFDTPGRGRPGRLGRDPDHSDRREPGREGRARRPQQAGTPTGRPGRRRDRATTPTRRTVRTRRAPGLPPRPTPAPTAPRPRTRRARRTPSPSGHARPEPDGHARPEPERHARPRARPARRTRRAGPPIPPRRRARARPGPSS